MYPEPPTGPITWRSVLAGYLLAAGIFVLLVAVSYPAATLAVVAAGAGSYLLYRARRVMATTRPVRVPRMPQPHDPASRPK